MYKVPYSHPRTAPGDDFKAFWKLHKIRNEKRRKEKARKREYYLEKKEKGFKLGMGRISSFMEQHNNTHKKDGSFLSGESM